MTKHSHYFKDVSKLQTIDVYRVLQLFEVTDPCLQHAIKKLLVAGGRGAKNTERDVTEAIDSLVRWQDMRREENAPVAPTMQDKYSGIGRAARTKRLVEVSNPCATNNMVRLACVVNDLPPPGYQWSTRYKGKLCVVGVDEPYPNDPPPMHHPV